MTRPVDLIASYWTLAGPIRDFFGDDTSDRDFRDRVEAAARAGFTGIGLKDNDIRKIRARYSYAEMAAILRANGIRHIEIEALFDWFTIGSRRQRSDEIRTLLLEAASALGARHIKVVGDFMSDRLDIAPMAEALVRLCDQARAAGTRIGLEIIPVSNINSIASALALLRMAGAANGGLLLDIWHITRGGIPYDAIATIPPGQLTAVELADAASTIQGTLLNDTLHHRKLCGEGSFDIPAFLAAVARIGYDGPYGVEIISDEQQARPLGDAARRAYETTIRQFA